MTRTRAVPRRRPNINFQPRGNIDFERQRVAATRNINLASSSASSSSSSPNRSPASQKYRCETQWTRCKKDGSSKSCKTRR